MDHPDRAAFGWSAATAGCSVDRRDIAPGRNFSSAQAGALSQTRGRPALACRCAAGWTAPLTRSASHQPLPAQLVAGCRFYCASRARTVRGREFDQAPPLPLCSEHGGLHRAAPIGFRVTTDGTRCPPSMPPAYTGSARPLAAGHAGLYQTIGTTASLPPADRGCSIRW